MTNHTPTKIAILNLLKDDFNLMYVTLCDFVIFSRIYLFFVFSDWIAGNKLEINIFSSAEPVKKDITPEAMLKVASDH